MIRFIEPEDTVFQYESIVKTCDDYLHGYCHLFALTLKEYLGDDAEIIVLWQNEATEFDDIGFLAHAFIKVKNSLYMDCRGIVDIETIKKEYIIDEEHAFFIDENTEQLIKGYIIDECFENFEPTEKQQIIDFIDSNILSYSYY